MGSNYYGNCLSFIQKELPVEDVQTMPLAELAILVRTLVESYKAQDATDAVNLMKETYFNHGASGLVALEPPMDYPTRCALPLQHPAQPTLRTDGHMPA